jgi:hypothetical protein
VHSGYVGSAFGVHMETMTFKRLTGCIIRGVRDVMATQHVRGEVVMEINYWRYSK